MIRKLYTKLYGYFASKWWERKIYNEMRDIYEESGEFLDIKCKKGDRWASGFEVISREKPCQSVTVFETDWGKVTYIPSDLDESSHLRSITDSEIDWEYLRQNSVWNSLSNSVWDHLDKERL